MIRSLALSVVMGAAALAAVPAHASLVQFTSTLGPEVSGATGSGSAQITIDDVTNMMRLQVTFQGLSGLTTVSHIHAPTISPGTGTAGVIVPSGSTLPGFPTGVSSGSYDNLFDLGANTTYRTAFINSNGGTTTGARNALIGYIQSRQAYLNVHTTTFPGGEIRGFFQEQVPAPLPVLGVGAAMAWSRRMRRRLAAAA
jgi:hypothetical protein